MKRIEALTLSYEPIQLVLVSANRTEQVEIKQTEKIETECLWLHGAIFLPLWIFQAS